MSNKWFYFSALFALLLSPLKLVASDSGLEYSLAVDLLYQQNLDGESEHDGRLSVREAELVFYGPIDHRVDGLISFVAHQHHNKAEVELHEAYLHGAGPLSGSTFTLGQYFLNIGRLNPQHRHDWAFTYAPKFQRDFFSDEGVYDTGLELQYTLPTKRVFQLTLGLTSGFKWGHSHDHDHDHDHDHGHTHSEEVSGRPHLPPHYVRASHFIDFSHSNGLELGLNYLGRTDADANQYRYLGFDLAAKWREGRVLRWLVESEWWYRNHKQKRQEVKDDRFGGFLFVERAFDNLWALGLRADYFRENHDIYTVGVGAQATYRQSEFSWFRLSLHHEKTHEKEHGNGHGHGHGHSHHHDDDKDTRLMFQWVFILGAHPAHTF